METIKATGSIYEWNDKTNVSINMSFIYTAIIKESARCDNYASDILYEIANIDNAIRDLNKEEDSIIFGFRDMGVDHYNFIKSRIEYGNLEDYYRTICFIEITKHDGSIVVHANFYEPEEFNDVYQLLKGEQNES